MNHQQLIDTIMDNDKDIRFVTICNMVGDIEVTGQSEGIEKFLTTEETKENLESAAQAWLHARKTISKKIKSLIDKFSIHGLHVIIKFVPKYYQSSYSLKV